MLLVTLRGKALLGNCPDNREEGVDDVKSPWPLCPGLHTCYNGPYKEMPSREVERISKNGSQFGLESAIRLHEAGITSNRGSACHGECVLEPCTHRPSHHSSRSFLKSLYQPAKGEDADGKVSKKGEVVTKQP